MKFNDNDLPMDSIRFRHFKRCFILLIGTQLLWIFGAPVPVGWTQPAREPIDIFINGRKFKSLQDYKTERIKAMRLEVEKTKEKDGHGFESQNPSEISADSCNNASPSTTPANLIIPVSSQTGQAFLDAADLRDMGYDPAKVKTITIVHQPVQKSFLGFLGDYFESLFQNFKKDKEFKAKVKEFDSAVLLPKGQKPQKQKEKEKGDVMTPAASIVTPVSDSEHLDDIVAEIGQRKKGRLNINAPADLEKELALIPPPAKPKEVVMAIPSSQIPAPANTVERTTEKTVKKTKGASFRPPPLIDPSQFFHSAGKKFEPSLPEKKAFLIQAKARLQSLRHLVESVAQREKGPQLTSVFLAKSSKLSAHVKLAESVIAKKMQTTKPEAEPTIVKAPKAEMKAEPAGPPMLLRPVVGGSKENKTDKSFVMASSQVPYDFTDFRTNNRPFTEAVLPTQATTDDKKTSTMTDALVSNFSNCPHPLINPFWSTGMLQALTSKSSNHPAISPPANGLKGQDLEKMVQEFNHSHKNASASTRGVKIPRIVQQSPAPSAEDEYAPIIIDRDHLSSDSQTVVDPIVLKNLLYLKNYTEYRLQ